MTKLLDRHRFAMAHALGIDRRAESYRNYYAAEPDSPAAEDWRYLVSLGYATEGRPASGDLLLFHVTEAGKLAVLSPTPPAGET